jgi:peptidoglycan hydrolase-like protein with peptidoglycan-binding domain
MIRYRFTVLIATCITCLGINPSSSRPSEFLGLANAWTAAKVYPLEVAQAPPVSANQPVLQLGDRGAPVIELQKQLITLGYYDGLADGTYGESTQSAVSEFQTSIGLVADGVAGQATRNSLKQRAEAEPTASATPANPTTDAAQASPGRKIPWVLVGTGVALVTLGGGLFLLLRWFNSPPKTALPKSTSRQDDKFLLSNLNASPQDFQEEARHHEVDSNGHLAAVSPVADTNNPDNRASRQNPNDSIPLQKTTRLAKINIVDALIKDLQAPDPTKRRKAIWELAQRGDSRAVQPLIDLMVDSDSKQRSLILEALSQIGTRTLKPMNRALAISLQDENAEVRKNAIRDVTRIYELVSQASQLLCHAADDPNPEVQDTARWALNQLNRIHNASTLDSLPPSKSSDNPKE